MYKVTMNTFLHIYKGINEFMPKCCFDGRHQEANAVVLRASHEWNKENNKEMNSCPKGGMDELVHLFEE